MNIKNRIRLAASRKVRVKITRRQRSRSGFLVRSPDGIEHHEPTKRGALTWLLAKVRCHRPVSFELIPGGAR